MSRRTLHGATSNVIKMRPPVSAVLNISHEESRGYQRADDAARSAMGQEIKVAGAGSSQTSTRKTKDKIRVTTSDSEDDNQDEQYEDQSNTMHASKIGKRPPEYAHKAHDAPKKLTAEDVPALADKFRVDSSMVNDIYARIKFHDNDMLTKAESMEKTERILTHAFELVKAIGPEKVHELHLHYNAQVVLDRNNVARLQHYTLIVDGSCLAKTLPLDWGHGVAFVETSAPVVEPQDALEAMKKYSYKPGVVDLATARGVDLVARGYVDEGIVSMYDDGQHYLRPPATLAHNGSIVISSTFQSPHGEGNGIRVENHSFEAVRHLRAMVASNPKMTLHELYRSSPYRACMVHGPAQTLAMAAVAGANHNMKMELHRIPFEGKDTGKAVELVIAEPLVYAPTVFMCPVEKRVKSGKSGKTTSRMLFEVHCNTFGDCKLAVPPGSCVVPKLGTESKYYGYAYQHSPFGGGVVMRFVDGREGMQRIWELARYEQLSAPIDYCTVASLVHLREPHFGYPTGGMHFGKTLYTGTEEGVPRVRVVGQTLSGKDGISNELTVCHVSAGHCQPYQHSADYLSILQPLDPKTRAKMRAFSLELFPVSDLYDSLQISSLGVFTGGLNPEQIGWRTLTSTRIYADHYTVPMGNQRIVQALQNLALNYYDYCKRNHKTPTDMTSTLSHGSVLRNNVPSDPYWSDLTGDAVKYVKPHTLLVDTAWAKFATEKFKPTAPK